jgi:hypothetical protein
LKDYADRRNSIILIVLSAVAVFHLLYKVPIFGGTVPRIFPRRTG